MSAIGHTMWAFPGGHIPTTSTGHEPELTSYDQLCILNTGDASAQVEVTIYYSDREPVGPYRLTIAPRRVRHVRLNDLIDPQAIPLGTDYAGLVQSDVPVVVQFSRQDTRSPALAIASTLAFPAG